MKFNATIEYEVTTDLVTEPVSLEELKRHLNMLFDTDGAYEFSDDDTYLESIIKSSRMSMEQYTGLSFGLKTITAAVCNELGGIELPYGPIIDITSIHDSDDDELSTSDYKLSGLSYKRIVSPYSCYLKVVYTAGFTVLPDPLKRAVLEEAAYRYNHRGEEFESQGYCKGALELAAPFKRKSWIV